MTPIYKVKTALGRKESCGWQYHVRAKAQAADVAHSRRWGCATFPFKGERMVKDGKWTNV